MRIFIAFALILLSSCSTNFKSRSLASSEGIEINLPGEIVVSLLKPDSFREKYGPIWVLMDGGTDLKSVLENYPDVTLADLEMDTIPDARGRFLRMHNGDMSCEKDQPCEFNPDNTPLGGLQNDALKFHVVDHPQAGAPFNVGGPNNAASWYDYNNGRPPPPGKRYGEAHESRPKNVTVNFYLKVASCPENYNGSCR